MEDKRNELSFSDSWKQKDIELAAAAAIVVGTGALAAKGDLSNSIKYGKKSVKQAGKALDKYVKKTFSPRTRFLYNTGKKVINKTMNPKGPDISGKEYMERVQKSVNSVTDEQVEQEAKKRYTSALDAERFMKAKDPNYKEKNVDPFYIEEKTRADLNRQAYQRELKGKMPGRKKDRKPFMTKEEIRNDVVGSAIGGAAFAGGLTAFHALDQALRQNESTQHRDKSFQAAGSFVQGGNRMNKQAGYREVHDAVKNLGANTPKGAATALGFTGVSLGTASLLKKMKQDEEEKSKSNRIIIEMGETPIDERKEDEHSAIGGYGIASQIAKQASVGGFMRNLGGRGSELKGIEQKLKHHNYHTDAAKELADPEKVDELAKPYESILTPEKAKERVFEDQVQTLREADRLRSEGIMDEVARDRVRAGGTLAGVGALTGLAALHHQNRKGESNG